MQVLRRAKHVVTALMTLAPVLGAAQRIDQELIVACSKEADDARRLACYDGLAASAGDITRQSRESPSDDPQSASQPAATIVDDFGLEGSEAARQRRAQQAQSEETREVRSLSATVTKISREARGQLVITLDNNQVWRQKNTEGYFPIEAGDRITINAGLLGSHRMVNGKRSMQVTRVK